jgi:hypothetical protein
MTTATKSMSEAEINGADISAVNARQDEIGPIVRDWPYREAGTDPVLGQLSLELSWLNRRREELSRIEGRR